MPAPDSVRRAAVFLDRDGTINEEKNYLWRPEEFRLIPGAAAGIRLLSAAGYLVVVVTNQSGVARGYYGEADVEALHRHMNAELALEGAKVDACYFCPHHPQGEGEYRQECRCRKPLPGMVEAAAADLDIDLYRSFLIGDKISDVDAGRAAGCAPVLVATGYGEQERELLAPDVPVFPDLLAAAEAIVAGKVAVLAGSSAMTSATGGNP